MKLVLLTQPAIMISLISNILYGYRGYQVQFLEETTLIKQIQKFRQKERKVYCRIQGDKVTVPKIKKAGTKNYKITRAFVDTSKPHPLGFRPRVSCFFQQRFVNKQACCTGCRRTPFFDATQPIDKIYTFRKIAVSFEPMKQFLYLLRLRMP